MSKINLCTTVYFLYCRRSSLNIPRSTHSLGLKTTKLFCTLIFDQYFHLVCVLKYIQGQVLTLQRHFSIMVMHLYSAPEKIKKATLL